MNYNEEYKKLIKAVLNGEEIESRNSKTLQIPHYSFVIDNMRDDSKLKLRKMNYAGVLGEFLTFTATRPLTNIQQLKDNGCNYWDMFADEDGSINLDYANKLPYQIDDVVDLINEDPNSRRMVIDLWDDNKEHRATLNLVCCHYSYSFSVMNNVLHMTWVQRSTDCFLGLPSDVAYAHFLMTNIATRTGTEVGSCMFSLSNVHLYENSWDAAKEILNRTEFDSDKPLKVKLLK